MHPGLRTTTQKGTRSVYQQDGSLLGVWQNQPPISLTENHSPQPPSSVICKALLLPASGVEWNLLFWRKCPLESKGNDIKGAGSESLWQFSLVFFNPGNTRDNGANRTRAATVRCQNAATPLCVQGGTAQGALSLSSY